MKTTRFNPLVPLALATALTLSACSDGETATFEPTGQEAAAEQETPAEAQAAQETQAGTQTQDSATVDSTADQEDGTAEETDDTTQQSAAAAGINLLDLGDPIGTATIPASIVGDPEATMEVSLYDLRRNGSTVVANFSFRVQSEDAPDASQSLFTYLGSSFWKPFLIDTTNLTRHDVLGGSRSELAMTVDSSMRFSPGTTFYAYASFAAPPEDVTTMTVHLVDGAPSIPDVEIQ